MARLGVELSASSLRAVRVDGWPRSGTRLVEVAWERDRPEEAAQLLAQHVGAARRIAIAVDLSLLSPKRLRLPAVPAAERREILRLEPERFFAVRGEDIVPAVQANDDLVFAVKETPLASWVAALERLAPVDLVEPGPIALARALARVPLGDAVTVCDAGRGGVGVVEIRGGSLTMARHVFGDLTAAAAAIAGDAAEATGGGRPGEALPATVYLSPWSEERRQALAARLPGLRVEPLPAVAAVTGPFLAAYGAALGLDGKRDIATTLAPRELGRRIAARHRREFALGVAACTAAVAFAMASLEASRDRTAHTLTAALPSLRQRAAPALALQTELEALTRQVDAVRQVEAQRPDPLRVLLALSRRLPSGAYLRGVRFAGAAWQIDGYAPNAARLLAELAATREFQDVHFLSATNRAQVGERTYESFALAFRYAPAP